MAHCVWSLAHTGNEGEYSRAYETVRRFLRSKEEKTQRERVLPILVSATWRRATTKLPQAIQLHCLLEHHRHAPSVHLTLSSTFKSPSKLQRPLAIPSLHGTYFCTSRHSFYPRTMSDPSNSSLQALFDAALQDYEKQTRLKLVDHPLSKELENCHSVDTVMNVLQQQGRSLTKFRGADGKITRSLWRVVHVLHALSTSTALGEGIGLVRRMVF